MLKSATSRLPWRMKAILGLILATLWTASHAHAQLPTLDWAINTGSTGTDEGNAVIIDAQGNAYNAGSHQTTADLDPGAGVQSAAGPGIHLQKVDAQGNLIWAVSFASTGNFNFYDLALASNGDLLGVGTFTGTIDFDPGAGVSNLNAVGGKDIFLLRLTSGGNFVWAKNVVSGNDPSEVPRGMAIDTQGNIVLGGWFTTDADFDPSGAANMHYSAGGLDAFLAKYDGSGNLLWATTFGNNNSDAVLDLTLDANNNITAVGKFGATVDFDPGAGITNLTAAGNFDGFILRLDASGTFVFAQPLTTAAGDNCTPNAITTDSNGEILIAGSFFGYADLDPGPGLAATPSIGLTDMFLLKIDAGGNYLWSRVFGGIYQDGLYDVATDINHHIYVAATYEGTVDFDPGPGVSQATAVTYKDIAVVQFSSSGNFGWAALAGGAQNDYINQLRMSPQNDLYVTGSFVWNADFDPTGTYALTAVGAADAYLYRLSFCQATSTFSLTDTTCSDYTLNGITYTTTGTYHQTLLTNLGCDSVITLNLTVNPLVANILQVGYTLIASPTGTTYQWLDCHNGSPPIVGATSQSYVPQDTGIFAVVVTQGACIDTSACVYMMFVGVDAQLNAGPMIFPNPATGSVRLRSFKALEDVRVMNLLGQVLWWQKGISAQEIQMDLREWPRGIYIVHALGVMHRLVLE